MVGKSGYDSDGSDQEGQALILHQFQIDSHGKPIISSIPSHDPTEAHPSDQGTEEQESETGDLESGFFERPLRNSNSKNFAVSNTLPSNDPSREKDGRPNWFLNLLNRSKKYKHIRLFSIFALCLLSGLAIFLALGPEGKENIDKDGGMIQVGGDIWNPSQDQIDAINLQAQQQAQNDLFPTKVGFPGPIKTGQPPDFANEDTIKATPTKGMAAYETRVPQLNGFNPFESMGPLSPYFSSPGFGIDDSQYSPIPSSCSISQVQMLHRHGSRYPTQGSPTELVSKFISSLSPSEKSSFSGPLSFLKTYEYRLGYELLTPVGRAQLYDSGVKSSLLYESLLRKNKKKLFVRTGSQQRILDSSISWLQGFFGLESWKSQSDLEVQIESKGFNTTLAPYFACPRADETEGREISARWTERFLKNAVERLQPFSSPNSKRLTPDLLLGFMQLCSYDTVAFGHSQFCSLFTESEWRDYSYFWDLKFFYSYGNGNPHGPSMGVGWLNEFLDRLTNTDWQLENQTSENKTLNSNRLTFPVDRHFYVDFTHDSTIASVLAAMQLPDFKINLDPHKRDQNRKYKTEKLVPFAARLTFELLSCSSDFSSSNPNPSGPRSGSRDEKESKWLRMRLNDAIVPLSQLSPCEDRPDGLCSLASFLDSQKRRMQEAHWERC